MCTGRDGRLSADVEPDDAVEDVFLDRISWRSRPGGCRPAMPTGSQHNGIVLLLVNGPDIGLPLPNIIDRAVSLPILLF